MKPKLALYLDRHLKAYTEKKQQTSAARSVSIF